RFLFTPTPPTSISTLSLHDALPISLSWSFFAISEFCHHFPNSPRKTTVIFAPGGAGFVAFGTWACTFAEMTVSTNPTIWLIFMTQPLFANRGSGTCLDHFSCYQRSLLQRGQCLP